MNDPHVVALYYHVETDDRLQFDNAPPVEDETEEFHMRLADGIATFRMKQHYPSAASAREPVEAYLQAWSIITALAHNGWSMRLVFDKDKTDIIHRAPAQPDVVTARATFTVRADISAQATIVTEPITYPEPPKNFRISPLVEDMWYLFERYMQDRERLLPMANSCLTMLEYEAGDRNKAEKKYNIACRVLNTLGTFCATRGDRREARKLKRGSSKLQGLMHEEIMWLEAVLQRLILRAGEYACNPTAALPQLTMGDFPPLPEETKKLLEVSQPKKRKSS